PPPPPRSGVDKGGGGGEAPPPPPEIQLLRPPFGGGETRQRTRQYSPKLNAPQTPAHARGAPRLTRSSLTGAW
ncbi:hypothetical protein B8W56_14125, partial [Cronobacter sakazakii]